MTPEAIRQAFPITSTRAYLFSGGLAPAATPVRAAHDRWTDAWMYDPAAPYASYQHEWELARQRFGFLSVPAKKDSLRYRLSVESFSGGATHVYACSTGRAHSRG